MTSFYDKYLLKNDDPSKIGEKSNILKKDYTLDYTDYEKLKIAEQYNKLYANIYEKNREQVKIDDNTKIYNLSLKDLVMKSSTVYIQLLNDLSIYFSDKNEKDLNKLGLILTKDDNILYIGLLVLLLSFFLWIIEISS
jgi:ATP-dependent Zn protease